MPKVSQRKLIIHSSNVAAMAIILLLFFASASKTIPQTSTLSSTLDPRYDMLALQELPDSSFLQLFRMRFPCFLNLLQLLQPNPIFYNNSHNPQRELPIQLAIAICRLGSNGNGSAVYRLRNLFQVGYGTINLYTCRVITAVYEFRSSMITWPTEAERLELSQVMQEEGFPGCVGFVDGTTIPLSQKPPKDGSHYWDRKKRYSISVTLICDVNKKFISYLAGYPGSCHDAYVFSNMKVAQQPQQYFDRNQFLLADSAYSSDQYVIPAYKGKELLVRDNVNFNYYLAQSRISIRGKAAVKWIISCLILHNLLADLKDQWNELYEDEIPDPPPEINDDNNATDGLRGRMQHITLAHFE
ncbi:hypothetical protein PSHT_12080 [Puccinia striiformis]|uniref:DDE Tnp4 domain-containing protein n=1 Tax=Puccinia striiformis TaxID=27350 RepID=A0A2S4UZ34_9BASI|nr:hypothetical protein PSHT_12080 [Puccinia striiformis]